MDAAVQALSLPVAAALLVVGVLVLTVNGPPRALRRSEPDGPPTAGLDEDGARALRRWIDQYAWIGVGLLALGGVGLTAFAVRGTPLSAPTSTLPVAAALPWAAAHGLVLVVLSLWVLRARVRSAARPTGTADRISRVQGNFVEYVPTALILLALIAAAGAPPSAVHLLGASLLVARVLHAWGLGSTAAANYPRMIGALLTFLVIATEAVLALQLTLA